MYSYKRRKSIYILNGLSMELYQWQWGEMSTCKISIHNSRSITSLLNFDNMTTTIDTKNHIDDSNATSIMMGKDRKKRSGCCSDTWITQCNHNWSQEANHIISTSAFKVLCNATPKPSSVLYLFTCMKMKVKMRPFMMKSDLIREGRLPLKLARYLQGRMKLSFHQC